MLEMERGNQLYVQHQVEKQETTVEMVVGDGFLLRKTSLIAFVNAAEWPLSPSVGAGPTLNLVI